MKQLVRTGAEIYKELVELEKDAKEAIDAVNLVAEEIGEDSNAYRILDNASKEAHKALHNARNRKYGEQFITPSSGDSRIY
ncbi:hypothetical protein [Phage f2b1]|nr:hypothetical protein [Phage f2b1]